MKKYIPLEKIQFETNKLRQQTTKVRTILDKVSFKRLFLVWILMIVGIGFFYTVLQTENSRLTSTATGNTVSVGDAIYFSFITATSTGYGDIVPHGFFKVIVLCEVIVSLVIFAIVTSKLVSIKQEAVLNEIYEISFTERVAKIRSALYLFRIDLEKIMVKQEEAKLTKREVSEIWTNLSFLENTLVEFSNMVSKEAGEDSYLKKVDTVNMEIILNSLNQSFEKMIELIRLFDINKLDWKRTLTINFIISCLEHSKVIFQKVDNTYGSSLKSVKTISEEFSKKDEQLRKLIE